MSAGNGRDESARVASLSAHLTSARLVPTAALSSEQRSARVDELVTQGNALAAQVNFLTGALRELQSRQGGTDASVSALIPLLQVDGGFQGIDGLHRRLDALERAAAVANTRTFWQRLRALAGV